VRVMNLGEGDKVVDVARVVKEEDDESGEDEAEEERAAPRAKPAAHKKK